MKRVIIIHCWEASPDYCWYPDAKKRLEEKGFEVKGPAFPDTEHPREDKWEPFLKKEIGCPDENLVLVGHSVGCITILRYLETLGEGEKIGGAVLVAGFTDALGYDELKNFFKTPIDFEKIKTRSQNGFVAIHSDNDPFVPLKHSDIFKEKLGAEAIVKHALGHFSGPINDETSCLELPEVAASVEKLAG